MIGFFNVNVIRELSLVNEHMLIQQYILKRNYLQQNPMQSISNLNLVILQQQALRLYNHQYFDYIVTATCLSLAFLLGRLLHQKKFTNLLNMINDAEATRKSITLEKNATDESIRKTQQKKYLFLSLLFIVAASIASYCYFMQKVDVDLLSKVVAGIIILVLGVWGRLRYLKWKRSQLDSKLKQSQLTTENQVKEILAQIGPEITESLRFKLQRQIQENYRKQEQKQCQLSKCANEKRTYQKLYSLYKNIIADMNKFTWCKVCASQSNINLIDLGIQELDTNLVLYRKLAHDPKFLMTTEKCKQLINKMLEEWANLQPKLEFVCKRGCCIRFRELVEGLKKQHLRTLNDLKASLRAA